MKLATVEKDGRRFVGVCAPDDTLIDVEELLLLASRSSQTPRIQSMQQIIAGASATLPAIADALAVADSLDVERIDPQTLRWLPPVVRPGKICAVAMNNSASNARKISAPDHPAFFLKPASCFIGHGETVKIRRYYGSVHPEPELAVVIGRKACEVEARAALEHVFGYTIVDDITGNGMRAEDMFHYWAVYADPNNPDETNRVEQHLSYAARYKGSDTFGVMGPWLVTADEIPDPDALDVYCRIGDETIAEDSTRYYNYKVAEIISYLSFFMTLYPGDVISLGTAFKPAPGRRSIHHANLQNVAGPVEVEIEGLGTQICDVVIDEKPLGQWRLS
ncbi:MAG: fumarylacetoacetate hydrolase family protein [Gammaproteobacteria bacterium]|jgi:2-keto-4-pentenoate hydratase/2-oxohepta-3-ene-1,7-dioic acid hydratase in catechol pathway